ncbi:MAG TPA: hypothetical protein PKC41_06555, partial [Chitinophagaceae bacterium]|nr:hypothetical protein [Chitinophagaceae bacterium]
MNYRIYFLKFLFVLSVFLTTTAYGQAPQLFNYQGIARDIKGNPLSNQSLALKLSVLPTADAVSPEYEETQLVKTNDFGLYTLQIGSGKSITGSMKTVKWETGNKYIKVAIDPNGGNDFLDAGTTQLLSVPYALFADRASMASNVEHDKTRAGTVSTSAAGTGTLNFLTKFTAANTIYNSQIYDNGTSIGIGTALPNALSKLHMLTNTGNIEHIRMQNNDANAFGKFMMYNDVPSNYATFTKYGSTYPGGYPGVASQFPYANMLAFGNNLGPFLLSNNGNVGIGIVSGGVTNLKFNAVQATGYLGIGGSNVPTANVHFNNALAGDTLRITNAGTGHTSNDGLEIGNTGNAAFIYNKESSSITMGINSTPNIMTLTPGGNAELSGQIKILGGVPGAGKVLTSDITGLATWQNVPAGIDGKTILNGNTPPGIGIGSDGDFYVDLMTYNFYGPKSGPNWGTPISLIGPAGAVG